MTREKEIILRGIPAAPGIVTGKVLLLNREQYVIPKRPLKDDQIANEIKHFKDALIQTKQEVVEIKRRISEELSAEHGQIFSAHLLVIEDSMLIEEVISKIKKDKLSAEYIFQDVLKRYINVFSEMDDEYLKERISDINDVIRRMGYFRGNNLSAITLRINNLSSEKCRQNSNILSELNKVYENLENSSYNYLYSKIKQYRFKKFIESP